MTQPFDIEAMRADRAAGSRVTYEERIASTILEFPEAKFLIENHRQEQKIIDFNMARDLFAEIAGEADAEIERLTAKLAEARSAWAQFKAPAGIAARDAAHDRLDAALSEGV